MRKRLCGEWNFAMYDRSLIWSDPAPEEIREEGFRSAAAVRTVLQGEKASADTFVDCARSLLTQGLEELHDQA